MFAICLVNTLSTTTLNENMKLLLPGINEDDEDITGQ